MNVTYFNNTLQAWLLATVVVTGVLLVFPILRAWLHRGRNRWLGDDHPAIALLALLIDKTGPIVRVILALYLGQKLLKLPPKVDRAFDFVIILGAWIQVAIWAGAVLRFFVNRRKAKDVDGDGDLDPSPAVGVVLFIAQVLIWSIVVLLALANLGINVTGLVAGLGIGGIAVALAVQTILGDLLSSMSIAFDKPFMVDDMLRVDDIEGTVEHVGIRSTRLRSINGEQIVISNGDLLKSRIHNLGRMPERRVVQRILVRLEATPEQIEQATHIVEEAVLSQPGTRFVGFLLSQLGAFALEFDAIYFIGMRADTQPVLVIDAVNRAIFRRFASAGIRLAYPVERQFNEA